jgi:hypothetical protein
VVDLLVDATRQVHAVPGYFEQRGELPSIAQVDSTPVSKQALLYTQAGPSLLRRYLPLGLADFLQRLLTLAIPIIAIAFPLFRFVPLAVDRVFAGRMRRTYAALRRIGMESQRGASAQPREELLNEVDRLAERTASMQLPIGYAQEVFALRRNIKHVRDLVAARAARPAAIIESWARISSDRDVLDESLPGRGMSLRRASRCAHKA